MSPGSLANIVLTAGVLTTLVAGMLWMRAWRGRITGWKSCCRKCGFELRGLNPHAAACPECGASLTSAAALRPAARQNEPWRWWVALTATSLGVLMIWMGQRAQITVAGRWLCSVMPTPLLLSSLDSMPRFAGAELRDRVEAGAIPDELLPDLTHRLAEAAAANPAMRPAEIANALATLRTQGRMSNAAVGDALQVTLAGVQPLAGQPKPCKPGGTFIATASLPSVQGTAWITSSELRLAITGALVRVADGSWRTLDTVAPGDRPAREFDGAAFRAPAEPGTFDCELRISMQQPGRGFRADASVPFRLTVVDPSQLKLDFRSDAAMAARVREWLARGSAELDADGVRLRVSLPGDVRPLQSEAMAIGGRLLVVQDAVALDVGRVWIDGTTPTVILTPAAMPAALDRSRPATLRLQPDPEVALALASSSTAVMRDQCEVPVALPPPPAPRPAEPTPAPAPVTPPPAPAPAQP